MNCLLIGNDCWLLITKFLLDYKDWNRLRSCCKYFKNLCSLKEALKRWGELFHHPYFPTPNSFLEWRDNLQFYYNLCDFKVQKKNSLEILGLNALEGIIHSCTLNQRKLEYTQNEIVIYDPHSISIFDKKTHKHLFCLRMEKEFGHHVIATNHHIFIWEKETKQVFVYNSESLKTASTLESVHLKHPILYPNQSNGTIRWATTTKNYHYEYVYFKSKDENSFCVIESENYHFYEDEEICIKDDVNKAIVIFSNGSNSLYLPHIHPYAHLYRYMNHLIIVNIFHSSYQVIRTFITQKELIDKDCIISRNLFLVSVTMIKHYLFILETKKKNLVQLNILSKEIKEIPLSEEHLYIHTIGTSLVLSDYRKDKMLVLDFT